MFPDGKPFEMKVCVVGRGVGGADVASGHTHINNCNLCIEWVAIYKGVMGPPAYRYGRWEARDSLVKIRIPTIPGRDFSAHNLRLPWLAASITPHVMFTQWMPTYGNITYCVVCNKF